MLPNPVSGSVFLSSGNMDPLGLDLVCVCSFPPGLLARVLQQVGGVIQGPRGASGVDPARSGVQFIFVI